MGAATELSAEDFFDKHYMQTLPGFDPNTLKNNGGRDPLVEQREIVEGDPSEMYPGWHKKGTHYMKTHHQFKFGAKGDRERAAAAKV